MISFVVGLGNPGPKYAKTRHNVGFMVADAFASSLNFIFKKKDNYEIAEGEFASSPIFILKPLTFMNMSGKAVSGFLKYHNVSGENMFVVYDDLDMATGKLRLKWNGSGGGHKGVQSIIDETQRKDFFHLKIGIDKPPLKELVNEHVLSKFTPEEFEIINSAIKKAVLSLSTAITEGSAKAMNLYNG